jgi:hypothetical protein
MGIQLRFSVLTDAAIGEIDQCQITLGYVSAVYHCASTYTLEISLCTLKYFQTLGEKIKNLFNSKCFIFS